MELTQDTYSLSLSAVFSLVNRMTKHLKQCGYNWDWFSVGAYGKTPCHVCAVPLVDDCLAFWLQTKDVLWASDSGFWMCFECAYEKCVEAGVDLPRIPEEVM